MKKIFLVCMLACMAVAVQGQVYVGGSFSWYHDDDSFNETVFRIAPEIGYNLSPEWAVGVELGYGHSRWKDSGIKIKANSFAIAPYARYSFFKKGIVRLFVDGGLGFSTYRIKDGHHTNGFEIGVKPGIALDITKNISFIARYGFLGYRDDYAITSRNTSSRSGIDFNTNSLSIGMNFNF